MENRLLYKNIDVESLYQQFMYESIHNVRYNKVWRLLSPGRDAVFYYNHDLNIFLQST